MNATGPAAAVFRAGYRGSGAKIINHGVRGRSNNPRLSWAAPGDDLNNFAQQALARKARDKHIARVKASYIFPVVVTKGDVLHGQHCERGHGGRSELSPYVLKRIITPQSLCGQRIHIPIPGELRPGYTTERRGSCGEKCHLFPLRHIHLIFKI